MKKERLRFKKKVSLQVILVSSSDFTLQIFKFKVPVELETQSLEDYEDEEIFKEEILLEPIKTQSRFHDFKVAEKAAPEPPSSVPMIIETKSVLEQICEPNPEIPKPEEHMDLLDIDRDPAILSDSSDTPYETLEVEFIDDDADWEDDEFDDEPDEIYSGDDSPEAEDIESPISHDEEEEEAISDVDDTELMARLEAKYGKLNI